MSARDLLFGYLHRDLVGPQGDCDEVIAARPSDQYLTGILHPPPAEERDASAEDDEDRDTISDDDGSPGDSIGMSSMRRPNMMGISFAVRGEQPRLWIRGLAGRYTKRWRLETGALSEVEIKGAKVSWQRRSVELIAELPVAQGLRDFDGPAGLRWWVRALKSDDLPTQPPIWQVTVALTNENRPGFARDEIEEGTFFQVGYEVTILGPSQLTPRASRQAETDEDSLTNGVIYRNAREWAVGHTCAATWSAEPRATLDVRYLTAGVPEEGEKGRATAVRTTWLPLQRVRSTSADGHALFTEESEKRTGEKRRAFDAEYLAHADEAALLIALETIPAAYERWLGDQEHAIDEHEASGELTPGSASQARSHVANGMGVVTRMRAGIDVLRRHPLSRRAFQLAQRAMCIQRRWAYPDQPLMRWRPFQLGFQLLALTGLVETHDQNGQINEDRLVMDLLWFPTGGGKTEAYLGLTAFVLFYRRLRGNTAAGDGVAVLMRYTLRLLTVQQFERAARLVLACDLLRRQQGSPFGQTPFSVGLWVGSGATPNDLEEAVTAEGKKRARQLARCPACNTDLGKGFTWEVGSRGSVVRCDAPSCDLKGLQLGVWTIDEELYQHRPSLVIGTIDKFAQIVRNPKTARLLGSDDVPPDLIIQDELHLISGPLGTVAGLYEAAIDLICTRNGVPPKVIGSTATIRRASEQVLQLFNRSVLQFPPPILNAEDSCFAVVDHGAPGRLYCGVTTAGRSPKFVLQAVCASLMQGACEMPATDKERDPYWTLVAYFNSLRELGGALVMMQDDVEDSIRTYANHHGRKRRVIDEQPMELTSRVDQSDIPHYLKRLEEPYPKQDLAAVLATNMISVGVDIPRLGLMVVNGQPKSMAEYIQATSRVGRGNVAGIVVTSYNVGRPRDRSHFEAFRTWHQTLYREVEATSVTPFAPRARDRALHAAVVALARHCVRGLRSDPPSLDPKRRAALEALIDDLASRAAIVEKDPSAAVVVRTEAIAFLDEWEQRQDLEEYWAYAKHGTSLLASLEDVATAKAAEGHWKYLARGTPNSMRNVEPETSLRLTERLATRRGESL